MFLLKKWVAGLLVPPAGLLLLLVLGGLIRARRPRLGNTLLFGGLVAGLLMATAWGAQALQEPFRWYSPPATAASLQSVQAIVILGGGRSLGAIEYPGAETVDATTLERLRFGARLALGLQKPVLVSGGRPGGGEAPEARLMTQALGEYGVKVSWVEDRSNDTVENARFSRRVAPAAIHRIALVTDVMHMARARIDFERAGFEVVAAPMGFRAKTQFDALDFVPNATGFAQSCFALREFVGFVVTWLTP